MIDLKLVQSIVRKYSQLLSYDEDITVLSGMQQQAFFMDKSIRSDDPRITNFDSFGFAWDRQTRDSKLRILAIAYRSNKALFDQSDIKFRAMHWEKLNKAQQAQIITASSQLLVSVLKLFADQYNAEQILGGWHIAIQEKEHRRDSPVMQSVRAA